MLKTNNFHQLLKLFDKYIYSSLNDKIPTVYRTNIGWDKIAEYFPEEDSPIKALTFKNTLMSYAATYITILKEDGFFSSCCLVSQLEVNEKGLSIDHSTPALRMYLNRENNIMVTSKYINDLFLQYFKSDILYSYLCMGNSHACTFDDIKNEFNTKLSNPQFVYRIIRPAEKTLFDLYNASQIPFYFKAEIEKSSVGSGGKLLSITFKITDYTVVLRRQRMRNEYLEYIKEQINYLFPLDHLFLIEEISGCDDETVEEIYMMIKYIGKDPESYKVMVDEYVKHKLQNRFKINFPRINASAII
jgi:hypothetical protein